MQVRRGSGMRWLGWAMAGGLGLVCGQTRHVHAESCTTQAQMTPVDRDGLARTAQDLSALLQKADTAALQTRVVPELAGDFAGVRQAVVDLSGHLKGDTLQVRQVYLLDATGLAAGADAQFFCALKGGAAAGGSAPEVDFSIRGLTSGVYGFALVEGAGDSPWRVSMLLRRNGTQWQLAGFFPGPTEAAGHDGLWYWREARRLSAAKQTWNAWLLFGEAEELLRPAVFVQTTHLEKLAAERKAATPMALSGGLSAATPLVIQGPDGKEYRIVELRAQGSPGRPQLEVFAAVDVPGGAAADAAASIRAASDGAARALVAAYPELRGTFGGVLVSLEHEGQAPFVTDHAMADLH